MHCAPFSLRLELIQVENVSLHRKLNSLPTEADMTLRRARTKRGSCLTGIDLPKCCFYLCGGEV